MEIFYWPLLDLLVWGFLTVYLSRSPGAVPQWTAFLLGAMILWDILYRSQQAICVSFLEEMWSRNLLNLFASPLSPGEFVGATMLLSLVKFLLASALTVALAYYLYAFNLFELGFWLVPLVFNLIVMGWVIGIVTTAVILRYGERAEVLAWGLALLVQPFSAVFYPVSALPSSLRPVAYALPSTYVFEGMREIITRGSTGNSTFAAPFLLNAAYLALAWIFFKAMYRQAQEQGKLTKLGE
ncbi:MAG: ABC transporter permease [Elusimicrobia bacterium]|nr:ABC transporter permease [Elusimicrobiota bacterium]MDE2425416.1 ABC transporter permease [Elusimicrobiota bacterium]